ncbi:MAG: hypothetical protein OIF54_12695 [Cohaesibacter sp.]|nr:hypothetical protein [Cohaesibacter sp.]
MFVDFMEMKKGSVAGQKSRIREAAIAFFSELRLGACFENAHILTEDGA